MNDTIPPTDPTNCEHRLYLLADDSGDYYCPKCKTHFDQSAVAENPTVKESLTVHPAATQPSNIMDDTPSRNFYIKATYRKSYLIENDDLYTDKEILKMCFDNDVLELAINSDAVELTDDLTTSRELCEVTKQVAETLNTLHKITNQS